MQNLPLIIIICALLSILPAGTVFMVLWARVMHVENRISAQLGVKDDIVAVSTEQKKSIARMTELDCQIAGLDDRLKNYNNRLSVKERHEKEKEKEIEKDEISPVALPQLEQFDLFRNNKPQPTTEQPKRLTLVKKSA
jgi:uncharacterized coiled-coil protein SlyX